MSVVIGKREALTIGKIKKTSDSKSSLAKTRGKQ
jgi:hypothetical protein